MMIVDVVIVVVVLISVLTAAKSGLMVEVFSLAGLILGLVLASWDYQKLVPWVGSWVRSAAVADAIAFVLIAVGVMIVAAVTGQVVRWSVQSMGLGWADRIAGAVFGLVKGCALVTVGVIVVAAFWPHATWFRQSRLVPGFLDLAHRVAVVAPADLEHQIRNGVEVLRKDQPGWMKPTV
jgi:membrane protein required for colicin V production